MNSVKIVAAICFTLAAFASCKKREKYTPIVPTVPDTAVFRPVFDFMKLQPGNYWIYENFEIDSFGVATSTGRLDSCYISEDSVIEGYTTLVKDNIVEKQTLFLRNAGNNVVDNNGRVHFSQDYTAVFLRKWFVSEMYAPDDTVAYVKHYMGDRNKLVKVPAGTFHTTAFIEEYDMHPPWDTFGKKRYYYRRYADGVGLVSETVAFYLQSPNVYERRLVRYNVKRK